MKLSKRDVVIRDDEAIRTHEGAGPAVIETNTRQPDVIQPLLGRREIVFLLELLQRRIVECPHSLIRGTWTDPTHRQRGLAARLTAFIVGSLLAERPAVHLVVDDDNAPAIALYRSLGFEELGRCYMAYLSAAEGGGSGSDGKEAP